MQRYKLIIGSGKATLTSKIKKISTLKMCIVQVVFLLVLALPTPGYAVKCEHTNFIKMKTYTSKLPEITLKYKAGEHCRIKITQSHDAAEIFRKIYDADLLEYREEFILLLLNKANNTIGFIKLSSGGLTGTVADPRMILSTALLTGATGIILSHNHPSGNLYPSDADRQLTDKINKASKLIDIHLLDHVIITKDGYYSFADNGLINNL